MCFVPDNVIAAVTPLFGDTGNDPWTNISFVDADLTKDGLKGDGSSKLLRSGVIPSNIFSNTNAGLSVYSPQATSDTKLEFGVQGANNSSDFSLYTNNSGTAYFFCWRFINPGQDYLSAPAPGNGFFSGSRDSATSFNLYFGNAATPLSAIATGNGSAQTGSAIGGFDVYEFNEDLIGATNLALCSPKRHSFSAFHDALTLAETTTLFTLVQQLRMSLGGGFS